MFGVPRKSACSVCLVLVVGIGHAVQSPAQTPVEEQYYTPWMQDPGAKTFYRFYYFTKKDGGKSYEHHRVVYDPARRVMVFENPQTGRYWGLIDGGKGGFDILQPVSNQQGVASLDFKIKEHLEGMPSIPRGNLVNDVNIATRLLPPPADLPDNLAQQLTPQRTSWTSQRGIEFVLIPAGEFWMGTDEDPNVLKQIFPPIQAEAFETARPRHKVRISRPFYVSLHEVTFAQFEKFIQATKYVTTAEGKNGTGGFFDSGERHFGVGAGATWRHRGWNNPKNLDGEHPVVNVSWDDAREYCKWLSVDENRSYRLPTEAEWEYVCRAGSASRFAHGMSGEIHRHYGNVADQTLKKLLNPNKQGKDWTFEIWSEPYPVTTPACTFYPNAFGVYDMHGNVWEWCQDYYNPTEYEQRARVVHDPRGPAALQQGIAPRRVIRGGSWTDPVGLQMSWYRNSEPPTYANANIGFRLVLELN